MTRIRVYAALGAVLLGLSVNLAAPLSASRFAPLQTAVADDPTGTVDCTDAWNSCCAHWEFPSASFNGTFTEAWNSGSNHHLTYAQAITGVTANVSSLMAINLPPPSGDDELSIRIPNWPLN